MAIAAALMLILPLDSALACQCKGRDHSPSAILASADVLFYGVAVSEQPGNQAPSVVTTFKVVNGFKGIKPGKTVKVAHRKGRPASCGIVFEIGSSYLVRASGKIPELFTSRCSMLGLLGADAKLIDQFKKLSRK